MLNHVALIVSYGRSGTYFMQSLLDGHPELISFPPIYTSAFLNELLLMKQELKTKDGVLDFTLNFYEGCFLGRESFERPDVKSLIQTINMDVRVPFSESEFSESYHLAYTYMEGKTDNLDVLFFCTLMLAFDCALYRHKDVKRSASKKLLFQLHRADFFLIDWFSKNFKSISLIHMIRAPLVTFRSNVKFMLELRESQGAAFSHKTLNGYLKMLLFGGSKVDKQNVDHFAVKLESLHAEPQRILGLLCHRLGIKWVDTLLVSSINAQSWSNLAGRQHISSFMPDKVNEQICVSDLIPEQDAIILESALSDKLSVWEYATMASGRTASQSRVDTHRLLVEYLPSTSSVYLAQQASKDQIPIFRDRETLFLLTYARMKNHQWIEVLK